MTGSTLVHGRTYELSLTEPSLFQNIRARCWDEVHRRLEESPEAIKDRDLFTLFVAMSKLQMQLGTDKPVDEAKARSITDAIKGLPAHRQVAMLEQAIGMLDELGEDSTVHRYELGKLKGDTNGSTPRSEVPGEEGDAAEGDGSAAGEAVPDTDPGWGKVI